VWLDNATCKHLVYPGDACGEMMSVGMDTGREDALDGSLIVFHRVSSASNRIAEAREKSTAIDGPFCASGEGNYIGTCGMERRYRLFLAEPRNSNSIEEMNGGRGGTAVANVAGVIGIGGIDETGTKFRAKLFCRTTSPMCSERLATQGFGWIYDG
jgi:hypothetical protein